MKRVAPHVHVGDRLLDLRHVASDALAALASCFVMSVFLDRRGVRAVWRIRAVTIQAKNVSRFPQEPIVIGTVRVMATKTSDAACVHQAVDEVIALHTIFVCGSVRKMRESRFAQFMIFQRPEITQTLTHIEAYWPIVSFSRGRSDHRPSLRMALNAGIGSVNVT